MIVVRQNYPGFYRDARRAELLQQTALKAKSSFLGGHDSPVLEVRRCEEIVTGFSYAVRGRVPGKALLLPIA
jgi:hypothetical protein